MPTPSIKLFLGLVFRSADSQSLVLLSAELYVVLAGQHQHSVLRFVLDQIMEGTLLDQVHPFRILDHLLFVNISWVGTDGATLLLTRGSCLSTFAFDKEGAMLKNGLERI